MTSSKRRVKIDKRGQHANIVNFMDHTHAAFCSLLNANDLSLYGTKIRVTTLEEKALISCSSKS